MKEFKYTRLWFVLAAAVTLYAVGTSQPLVAGERAIEDSTFAPAVASEAPAAVDEAALQKVENDPPGRVNATAGFITEALPPRAVASRPAPDRASLVLVGSGSDNTSVGALQAVLIQDTLPGPLTVAALSFGGFLLAFVGVAIREKVEQRKQAQEA